MKVTEHLAPEFIYSLPILLGLFLSENCKRNIPNLDI